MSYNNHDDGNPFYSEVPTNSPSGNVNNNPQNNQNIQNNQPQAIFTNTNVNFDEYSVPRQSTQYQPDLQFQSFNHTSIDVNQKPNSPINNNRIGGGGGINSVPEGDFSETANLNSGGEGSQEQKKYSFYQVQYYRYLFNVDTNDVGHRLIRSMLPIKFSFFDLISENPDVYGPFWVTTTLVFIIAATSNLNSYFHSVHSEWEADFKPVVYSAIAIYGYSFIIPLILWGVFKWMKLGINLLSMLCIYGYALFIFVPASILCLIPFGLAQWVIVGFASLVSGAFLVTNIFAPLKNDHAKRGLIIVAVIAALHLGLALLLKLYFFANNTDGNFVTPTESPTSTPTTTPTQTPTVPPTDTPVTTTTA